MTLREIDRFAARKLGVIKEETTTVFHATLSTRRISLVKPHNAGSCKLRIVEPGVGEELDRYVEATIKTEEDLKKLEALVKAARTVLSGGYGTLGAVDAAFTEEALDAEDDE